MNFSNLNTQNLRKSKKATMFDKRTVVELSEMQLTVVNGGSGCLTIPFTNCTTFF